MDEAFEKLRLKKQNSVENLVMWMKKSKVIDDSKEAEENAMKLFADCRDVHNVQLEKFKQALAKLADEQKRSIEEFSSMLVDQVPRILQAAKAGASAFVESYKSNGHNK